VPREFDLAAVERSVELSLQARQIVT